MNSKQRQLFISWIIALCAMYVAFSTSIMLASFIAFLVVIFRDTTYEKTFLREFMERNKALSRKTKQYVFIASTGFFLYVIYSLMKGEYEFLENLGLMKKLLLATLWPFIVIGVAYEISLFRRYGNEKR